MRRVEFVTFLESSNVYSSFSVGNALMSSDKEPLRATIGSVAISTFDD